MSSSSSSSSVFAVSHPSWKGLHFKLGVSFTGIATFNLQLYSVRVDECEGKPYEFHTRLNSADAEKFVSEVRQELKLEFCDWTYCAGNCVLIVDASVLKTGESLYALINAFIRRDLMVYMTDGSQVNFFPRFGLASREKQEELFLDSVERFIAPDFMKTCSPALLFDTCTAPVEKEDFWRSERGKKFAREIAKYKKDW